MEGAAERPDPLIRQSPDTFLKTFVRMQNLLPALLLRKVRIQGLRAVGAFAKLVPNLEPEGATKRPAQRSAANA